MRKKFCSGLGMGWGSNEGCWWSGMTISRCKQHKYVRTVFTAGWQVITHHHHPISTGEGQEIVNCRGGEMGETE